MPTPEDIDNQQQLLAQHRANVQILLGQIAAQGGPSRAQLGILNSLDEQRAEIARVKAILRSWGVEVADHPDDEASAALAAERPGQALHQLRAPVADFVGREEAIAKLVAALRKGPGGRAAAISGVRGMGGIGKTELAYAVADLLQADYPDAQLVLELRGASEAPLSPAQALQQVIGAFRPAEKLPEELGALQALYRTVLAGQRVLILADDARDAAQVRPLLPPVGCALLVTSRQRFLLDGMTSLDLDRLSEDAAVQLLRRICSWLDAAQAQQLAALCGELPLALRVSAGLLANNPARQITRYLTQLADERQRLRHMRSPDDPERDVAAVLHLSYAALDQPTQSAFRQLGVLAADVDLTLIAAVLDQEGEQAEEVLECLLHRSLVEYDAARERWGLHDLVRVFALERLVEADEERAARLRYAKQVIQVVAQANRHYRAGGEGVLAGLAQFDRERAHREAVRAWLWVQPSDPVIDTLLWEEAGATGSIEVLRDPVRTVRLPRWERAASVVHRHGDRRGEGMALGNLASAYGALGETCTAIFYYEQALAIRREVDDRVGEGWTLGSLGNTHLMLGEPHTAIRHYEPALAIIREVGDRAMEERVQTNLGIAFRELGEVYVAIGYLEQALTIAREVGGRHGEGMVLGSLGNTYLVLGEVRVAISYLEQALTIAREVGDRREEGMVLGSLGNTYLVLGEVRVAIGYLEQALTIMREVGDRRREGRVLGSLGAAHAQLGNAIAALVKSDEALHLARVVGDQQLEGQVLCNLGNAQALLDQGTEADTHYQQSLTLLDHLGYQSEVARTRWAYGQFLVRQGERERGIALMAECVAYEQRIGHAQADEHAALVDLLRAGGSL